MAKAIDPRCPRFVGMTRLPAGKYEGRTLAEIGSTMDGLVYLYQIVAGPESPSFMRSFLRQLISDFVDHPRQHEALFHTGVRT